MSLHLKRLFRAGLILIILSLGPVCAGIPRVLPVLVYHHIQNHVTSDVSCTPEQFEAQLKAILAAGYTPLTIEQTARFLADGLEDKIEKPVLITFDDGYESLYTFAFPVSQKLKIPMTVFVITSRIGRRLQFAEYLHENQMAEMYRSGLWDFGSHTHDMHSDNLRIFDAFGPVKNNPVIDLMTRDLAMSSSRIQAIVGKKPEAIAWPYGKFNGCISTIARKAGFKLHFTSCSGYNEVGANPFSIKRIPVTSRDNAFSVLKKISRIR